MNENINQMAEELANATPEEKPISIDNKKDEEDLEEAQRLQQQQQQQQQRRPSNIFDLVFGLAKLGAYDIPKGIGNSVLGFQDRLQSKKVEKYTSHFTDLNKNVQEFQKELDVFNKNEKFKAYNDAINANMNELQHISDITERKQKAISECEPIYDKYFPSQEEKEDFFNKYNSQVDKIDSKRKVVEDQLLSTVNHANGLKDNDVFMKMHKENPQALENHMNELNDLAKGYEKDILKPSMDIKSNNKPDREKELEETKKKIMEQIKETIESIKETILAIINSIKSVFGR